MALRGGRNTKFAKATGIFRLRWFPVRCFFHASSCFSTGGSERKCLLGRKKGGSTRAIEERGKEKERHALMTAFKK